MRARALLAAALLGCFEVGCLVQIEHVGDASREFAAARGEALRVQGRPGPAKEFNALVFDKSEHKLVRVSVPMWLVRKVAKHAQDGDDDRAERDGDEDYAARAVRRHVSWQEVERAGLGILVEVQEDDGAQVLVWLR